MTSYNLTDPHEGSRTTFVCLCVTMQTINNWDTFIKSHNQEIRIIIYDFELPRYCHLISEFTLFLFVLAKVHHDRWLLSLVTTSWKYHSFMLRIYFPCSSAPYEQSGFPYSQRIRYCILDRPSDGCMLDSVCLYPHWFLIEHSLDSKLGPSYAWNLYRSWWYLHFLESLNQCWHFYQLARQQIHS